MIFPFLVLSALAQEEIEVVGEGLDPAETSSSVTIIDVDQSMSASVDVADALRLAPGTVVHRLGGLGSWSSVSIRGSTSRQVEVFIDGVPLNPEGAGTVDLSELPLRAFERLEVYRGSAPPHLGSASIGGAVNLVTGDASASSASLGAGSFGTVRGSAAVSSPRYALFVDGFKTDGDFRYFQGQSTVFIADDDEFVRRRNNDKLQGNVLGRLSVGDEKLAFHLLNAFVSRGGGVPGFTHAPTEAVRYGVTRDLLVGTVEGLAGPVRVTGRTYGMVRQESLDDRDGEIGVGRIASEDWSRSLGGFSSVNWGVSSRLGLFASGEIRADQYDHRDSLSGRDPPPRGRNVGRASLSADIALLEERLFVSPVGRLVAADRVDLSPQLGARLVPNDQWALKGSVGRYVRPPDLLELYGDRGSMRGNPDLTSEIGWNADLGVQARHEADPGFAQLELGGFWTESVDRIVLLQNSQGVSLPQNLQNARIRGLEFAANLGWMERVESSTNFTRTLSQNLDETPAYSDKQLPRIPGWEFHQRSGVVWRALRLGHRYDLTAANYWDLTNWFPSAPRHIHGAFVRVSSGSWSVEGDVLNLTDSTRESVPLDPLSPDGPSLDQSVTDFAGYPLPGRTFLLTMRWDN